MGKTVRGPMGPPGPPGPPGGSYYSSETSSTSCASPNLRNAEPLACPASVTSFDLLPTASVEAGTLVYLRDENKLVLKTASTWVELQVSDKMRRSEVINHSFLFFLRRNLDRFTHRKNRQPRPNLRFLGWKKRQRGKALPIPLVGDRRLRPRDTTIK